ncbi:MAG TPA: beta-ketoacyl synthase N-terminal-like domain-containing protein, partial [Anaerolinea sp.]|nr:beta-ketoacyl synthase N-terminal-like domain-containing protein [Anaerolinea sp.]
MPVQKPVAIVGLGAILPDAMNVASFWSQIKSGQYSITDVPDDRWDPELYYDPDPTVPDKTYSKIGGWVRGFKLDPFIMGIAIPPSVIGQMDEVQQWAIAAAYQALTDYGYPKRKLDQSRTAVILGNGLGGEKHYISTMRIRAPEFMRALETVPAFQGLPATVQQALLEGMRDNIRMAIPEITEDTMPGELGNIIAGRVANVFNFQGPNFVTDAACASSLAALQAAVEGLNNYQFDTVLTGGADRMMGVEGFVKFCKIGALSPDGSRPYADGANGFVMGEGTGVFLLKCLEDAERDGDAIYAVVRGSGSSSDGKGKGITAPNPSGQIQALERAWKNAGLSPETVGMIEGHGTSTRVGDVVEVNSLNQIFGQFGLPKGKIALGSVKSNIGHLKSAAGAAGLLKAVLSLHEKVLLPSVNFDRPNPNIEFSQVPFAVNTQLRPWETRKDEVRRAGVSSFGFGGTNFHVILDEYIPGVLSPEPVVYRGAEVKSAAAQVAVEAPQSEPGFAISDVPEKQLTPYRGLLFLGAESTTELKQKLAECLEGIRRGQIIPSHLPEPSALRQPERLAIDYKDEAELLKRAERALAGFDAEGNPWQALVAHGVFRGSGT